MRIICDKYNNNFNDLVRKITEEIIVSDLNECLIPDKEAKVKAKYLIDTNNQDALNLQYRVEQVISKLRKLGYLNQLQSNTPNDVTSKEI